MAMDGLSAMRAYAAAAKSAGMGGATGIEDGNDASVSFGNMLQNAVSSAQRAGAVAETAAMNSAVGRADIVDVATAVAAAETTLQTMVAVRDEVIRAYQDIMRMPI
jgi:flagellar hook-basal body complex protein FliE